MPFIHDQTEANGPADGSDLPLPRVDQFFYLPPPAFGGAREPVHFSVGSIGVADEPQQALGTTSLWRRLLSWRHVRDAQQRRGNANARKLQQSQRPEEQRRQQLFSVAIPKLRETGVRLLYCRYDGGHDEGFSWLDSAAMKDGGRISATELVQRLHGNRFMDEVYAAGIMPRRTPEADQNQAADFIEDWLCNEWASLLLSSGFGTGEYLMYGAFTVDIEACTINDDRSAGPIVQNIQISK